MTMRESKVSQDLPYSDPDLARMPVPKVNSLAQLTAGAPWRLELHHARRAHLLIWTTRGQGICTLGGLRRGLGAHNLLVIPARTLMAVEFGKQGFAQTVEIPTESGVLLPDEPMILRLRDAQAQGELTAILDAMTREQNAARPFAGEAMLAHGGLLSIWLRRALLAEEDAPRQNAAERLTRAFTALVARDYQSGKPMADYAAALGVTPTHLTRSCKQVTGQTAADLITECTLHAARERLERGALPIQTIAAELGFGSAAYFTRFVQHHTGRTPSALRKIAQDRPRASA